MLAVKANQPRPLEEVVASFADAFEGHRGEKCQLVTANDTGHERDVPPAAIAVRKTRRRDPHTLGPWWPLAIARPPTLGSQTFSLQLSARSQRSARERSSLVQTGDA